MINMAVPSMSLLAASGGDTVNLFNVSVEPGDLCTLSYTPTPGCVVNSVKWNHTNLVVASAGEDKKISLRRENGRSMGTIPVSGTDRGVALRQCTLELVEQRFDNESLSDISFSNKGSRYICSGGSGQVGHTSTITGAMYNCKDEHLASISLSGDLILHNLASGDRATELKDPHEQVLRVLDYSRVSRHLLVTAGDDGSVHLFVTKGIMGLASLEASGPASLNQPRRFSTCAERISTTASFSDGASLSLVSPKTKKTRFETREELLNSILSRSDALAVTEPGILPGINVAYHDRCLQYCGLNYKHGPEDPHNHTKPISEIHSRGVRSRFGSSTVLLTLEETLESFQKSIYSFFFPLVMGLSGVMNSILENQAELMKELSLPGKKTELRKML
uniref:Anaphase-promoting complex subunit 4 WD40 domain-containing protein n=1 Tax=Salix viminalis TaxID=40686 RepID=A0A6N2NL66_SALVM